MRTLGLGTAVAKHREKRAQNEKRLLADLRPQALTKSREFSLF